MEPLPRVWELYAMCGVFACFGLYAFIQEPGDWARILLLMTPFAFLFWFLRRFSS